MKAAVLYGEADIRFEDVDKPRIQAHEVLIAPKLVGICGTDLHFYRGHRQIEKPLILGHEFTGTVVEVGKSVSKFKIGDRVVGEHVIGCGKCTYCKDHQENLCHKKRIIGVSEHGALAEYLAVPAALLYKLPPKFTFEQAALVEPLSIAVYAVNKVPLKKGMTAAVLGQGMIGLMIAQVLKSKGVRVLGVDVVKERLDFAQRENYVDDIFVSSSESSKEIAAKYPHIDLVFEVVGHDVTAQLALSIVKNSGTVMLLGIFRPGNTIDLVEIVRKELTVLGSINCVGTFEEAIDLLAKKKVKIDGLITFRYPLEQTKEAFEATIANPAQSIKTVIEVS